MQTYGLDGVLIQRFVTEVNSPGTALDQRNKILQQMDAAASKHGRAYAMMWDMSGGSNQWDTNIKDDYNNYVKKYGPISNT
jgi:predicted secreted hydrolase